MMHLMRKTKETKNTNKERVRAKEGILKHSKLIVAKHCIGDIGCRSGFPYRYRNGKYFARHGKCFSHIEIPPGTPR